MNERLRDARDQNLEQTIYLNGDGEASHNHIMKAVDLVRQSGLTNVIFTVEPVE